ncbi:MaoC family dehydratase [Ideonella azotifigens]|uniref:MaoC family dehydratase n=1 Tax=Ideonella azotifigens TaxID=513160 RepID=A0ABN1JPK3_9BURK|nr:MaoC family dehydratase [Ideonella azotifigens]MCD2340084.1 MaoC family dehydratase [Ideonella azotifigens]
MFPPAAPPPPETPSADCSTLYWDDFHPGDRHAYGPMTVTREAIIDFASQWDPQPFHLDDAAAEASLFGRLAASGWHTAAMSMRMVCDTLLLRAASLGSPGVEQLRWHQPVYVGDVLRGHFVVLDRRRSASRPGVGLIKSRWETVQQDGALVLTLESWAMFRCRPAA